MASRCAATLLVSDFTALEKELDELLEERSYTSEKDEIDHEVSITDRVYELLCIVEDDLRRLDPSIQPVLEDYGSWVLLHDVIRLNPTRVVAGLRFLRCHLKLMENPQINIARLARRAELKRRFLSPTGSERQPASQPLPQLEPLPITPQPTPPNTPQSRGRSIVARGGCSQELQKELQKGLQKGLQRESLERSLMTLSELSQHEAVEA